MLYVATLSHEPEYCWMREENETKARDWIANIDDNAEEHDVDLRGAYVTPNEHTFYIIVEADSFEAVTRFLGSPFLPDHDGHIAPVLEVKKGVAAAFDEQ